MKALPIQFDESIPAWEKAIDAFLAEKERRSGSTRTVDAYTRTLQRFFGTTGKTPEAHWAFRSTSPLPRIKSDEPGIH
jgi:hypothetical protein